MTIKKLCVLALACFLSTQAWAGSMGLGLDPSFDDEGNFVATLSFGPGWARPREQQTLTLQPHLRRTYVPHPVNRNFRWISTATGTDSLAVGELFLGLRGLVNSVVEGQLGLTLGGSSRAQLKGDFHEGANPFFSLPYSYSVSNTRVAIKAKLLYDIRTYHLFPYLSGSAGASFNHSFGFTARAPFIDEIHVSPFSNRKETGFSYSAGVGLETPLEVNWRVGLGYEFVDWGFSALGPAVGQTVGRRGLRLKGLRAHELLVSLSLTA